MGDIGEVTFLSSTGHVVSDINVMSDITRLRL